MNITVPMLIKLERTQLHVSSFCWIIKRRTHFFESNIDILVWRSPVSLNIPSNVLCLQVNTFDFNWVQVLVTAIHIFRSQSCRYKCNILSLETSYMQFEFRETMRNKLIFKFFFLCQTKNKFSGLLSLLFASDII